jgi:hypothetical protein
MKWQAQLLSILNIRWIHEILYSLYMCPKHLIYIIHTYIICIYNKFIFWISISVIYEQRISLLLYYCLIQIGRHLIIWMCMYLSCDLYIQKGRVFYVIKRWVVGVLISVCVFACMCVCIFEMLEGLCHVMFITDIYVCVYVCPYSVNGLHMSILFSQFIHFNLRC